MRVLPEVIAHADWSVRPAKRWTAVILRTGDRLELAAVERFGDVADRLDRLQAMGPSVLLGLDATLGLPVAYARRAGITDFATWLRTTATFDTFSRPAAQPSEISVARPFYPARPGGARQADLVAALGVEGIDDLRRRCERSPPLARPACPLFWTLGANQVGKASLTAWAELVRGCGAVLWPFDGDLAALLAGDRVVVAETYPAACAAFLRLTLGAGRSKRRPADRVRQAPALLQVAAGLGVGLAPAVGRLVARGFGPSADGEDAYDAVVGVLGMIEVLRGGRPVGPPADVVEARTVEGWVFGL